MMTLVSDSLAAFASPRTLTTRPDGSHLRIGHLTRMDPVSVYLIAQLRHNVFVMEQDVSDEPELDGLDLDPGTLLLWWQRERDVLATIRILEQDGHMRLGRLAAARSARGAGYGGDIMQAAIRVARDVRPHWDIVIHGQSYLQRWYESIGFITEGPEFVEAGIAHYPMRLRHE